MVAGMCVRLSGSVGVCGRRVYYTPESEQEYDYLYCNIWPGGMK